MGGSGRQGINQAEYSADMAAVGAFRERAFGKQAARGSAAYFGTGPVYGATGSVQHAYDPSWSPAKRLAYESYGVWGADYYQPMPEQLYGYLQTQRKNPDVARVLNAIDPATRALRPMTPEERRKLFGG